jgi:hypothetical protein
MESSRSPLLSRIIAIVVLVVIAVIAIRLAIGVVAGLVQAVLWIAIVAALVVGALWARRTLKGGKRERKVEAAPSRELTYEDKVDAEMRRITEELQRKQGRA